MQAKPILIVFAPFKYLAESERQVSEIIGDMNRTIAAELKNEYHVLTVPSLQEGYDFKCFNAPDQDDATMAELRNTVYNAIQPIQDELRRKKEEPTPDVNY